MKVATQELPDVSGFKEHFGIRMTTLGDDCEILVALGHHEPREALRAFDRLMREDLGMDGIRMTFNRPQDAVEELDRRWAFFRTECGDCAGNPACRECAKIKAADWWLDYESADQQPGMFPVTVLDLENA